MTNIKCCISKVERLSENITSFDLEPLDSHNGDNVLEQIEAGSHIDVHLPSGLVRQYSIWDWSEDRSRISIAVKREDNGKGGSLQMHQLQIGDEIFIGGPRNHFKLQTKAPHYTLIAGGIGVTPIYAMARELLHQNAKVAIYYLVQKKPLAAFSALFDRLVEQGDNVENYTLHCDDESAFFDFNQLIKEIPYDSVIYACGPEPMLNLIIETVNNSAVKHDLHFERFSVTETEESTRNQSFNIRINSTGAVYDVPEDKTILSVLAKNGINVPSACSAGLCGTCITNVLQGEIDHRDQILSQEEKATNEFMCICISRAKSEEITLDL